MPKNVCSILRKTCCLIGECFFHGYSDGINIMNPSTPSISFSLTADMASIKIFQYVKSFCQTLGLYSLQTNQIRSLNLRILFFSTFTILNFSSLFGFLLFEAKSIQVFSNFISFHFFFIAFTSKISNLGIWGELLFVDCVGNWFILFV